jgi:replicative DNA helicase
MDEYVNQNQPPTDAPTVPVPRIPPSDTDAEFAVLSGMIMDREAIAVAEEFLKPDDFYSPANGVVYATMAELFARNIPVDVVTLSDKLAEKGMLAQIGGRDAIIRLAADFYTSANTAAHARIVAEKSLVRRLIKAGQQVATMGYEGKESAAAILEAAERTIFEISEGRTGRDFTHISEVLTESFARLEELSKNKGKLTGVETGFHDLDRITAGLQPSDLILLGARPSMGKTAFLLNIAAHAAIRKSVPTAVFSLEMSKGQLGNRMLAMESGIDMNKMRTGDIGDSWGALAAAIDRISNGALFIDDTPGISITEMRTKCRRLKVEKKLGLVIIDYLQLMQGSQMGRAAENRQLEISEISRSLKGLAKELNVPILVAAQLSRAVEARKDHRPMLSDLRESGAIEQDADIVAFLYREAYYNKETLDQNLAEVIIAKQRNGPTGMIELNYHGAQTKFENREYKDGY